MSTDSTTVSLVLGSGGARGLAHIGVIPWLAENGYTIRSISRASIGALVGGIYAASKLEIYAEWVLALQRMHVLRLLDPTIGRPGLFKGERIIGVLRELIGDCAIEELPISFTASASLINDNSYSKRIRSFVDSMRPGREPKQPSRGLFEVAFVSMQATQDTIARLRLSACAPDVMIQVPRNACGFFEFGVRRI
jgi:predicted acylesterase/phospholipase RssA